MDDREGGAEDKWERKKKTKKERNGKKLITHTNTYSICLQERSKHKK